MARQKMKGSLVYEILIVILTILLVGSILYPKSVWDRIERDTLLCHDRMMRLADAELLYLQGSEEANYDSSLVKVINFVRHDSVWVTDSTLATLRDSFYVNIVRDYLRDYHDMATKPALDSAFALVEGREDSLRIRAKAIKSRIADLSNVKTKSDSLKQALADLQASLDSLSQVIAKQDSLRHVTLNTVLDKMFAKMYTCPTVNDTYKVAIVDTSAIKTIKISCPITPAQEDSINSNFWFHVIGGGKIKNHGYVENGEPSWKPKKRK